MARAYAASDYSKCCSSFAGTCPTNGPFRPNRGTAAITRYRPRAWTNCFQEIILSVVEAFADSTNWRSQIGLVRLEAVGVCPGCSPCDLPKQYLWAKEGISMSDLQARFAQAQQDANGLAERPDNNTMLKLYALYKQATPGRCHGRATEQLRLYPPRQVRRLARDEGYDRGRLYATVHRTRVFPAPESSASISEKLILSVDSDPSVQCELQCVD